MSWSKRLLSACRSSPFAFFDNSKPIRSWVWQSRFTRRGHQFKSNHTKAGHATALKASAAGGAVIVALAHKPLSASIPPEQEKASSDGWRAALRSGSLARTREVAWLATGRWLSHYFRGTFIDEGPLDEDILISRGLYIAAADTRVYWLPPEDRLTTPTVCLAVNYAWRASLEEVWDLTREEAQAADDGTWYAYIMEDHVLSGLENRLDKWRHEKGVDRFFIILRFQDVTAYYVFDEEGWETVREGDILTKEDITIQQ
ncbi:hypothetical protein BJ170DRAFT_372200 [Xylariales sp. AK1849]|nr:hypothetical protein BJ170DRAFT_372200 [Xylariales sp. AK1849]